MSKQPVSGGKLAVVGLGLLATTRFVEGLNVGDLAKALLLLVPTLVGLSCLVIGIVRMVRARNQQPGKS